MLRHSSIFLTEEEKSGEEAGDDELPPELPDQIQSYQVKWDYELLPELPDQIQSDQVKGNDELPLSFPTRFSYQVQEMGWATHSALWGGGGELPDEIKGCLHLIRFRTIR